MYVFFFLTDVKINETFYIRYFNGSYIYIYCVLFIGNKTISI